MTLLKTIEKHHLGIHCTHCNHSVLITVAEVIQKVPEGYTFNQLKKNCRCRRCGQKKADLRVLYVTDAAAEWHKNNPRLL
nr:hypothetical protein 8 [Paracoccaceae bacterium]